MAEEYTYNYVGDKLSEHPSIDPKKLVTQEGPFKGAVEDVELASKGAEAEEANRNDIIKDKKFISSVFETRDTKEEAIKELLAWISVGGDIASNEAMCNELSRRVDRIPEEDLHYYVSQAKKAARSAFIGEMKKKQAERKEEKA